MNAQICRSAVRVDPTAPAAAGAAACAGHLDPSPRDSAHDGWDCTAPAGHEIDTGTEPGTDHEAADGTRW